MFTGLIEDVGEVAGAEETGEEGRTLEIDCGPAFDRPERGGSIAVDGVCLTAAELTETGFRADVSPETVRRTTLGERELGDVVHLERALRPDERLGGHFVQGHVDGVGVVEARESVEDTLELEVRAPDSVAPYLAPKGSIALDGVSLTVNWIDRPDFGITVLPHTADVTALGARHPGDRVNLEADILAKYVEELAVT